MKRLLAAFMGIVAVMLAAATWAATQQPVRMIDGGGASASGSYFRLTGQIGPGLAPPPGAIGPGTGGAFRLGEGFFFSAAAAVPPRNAADPAWLALTGAEAKLDRPWIPRDGHRAPSAIPIDTHRFQR
jgi:hypothetical protein